MLLVYNGVRKVLKRVIGQMRFDQRCGRAPRSSSGEAESSAPVWWRTPMIVAPSEASPGAQFDRSVPRGTVHCGPSRARQVLWPSVLMCKLQQALGKPPSEVASSVAPLLLVCVRG